MILDSKCVQYEVIDITEPGREDEKEFMQSNSTAKHSKHPLPPQIFNDEDYCGDYEDFDLANEIDELDKFLKTTLSTADVTENNSVQSNIVQQNGNTASREPSTDKDTSAVHSETELDERPTSTPADKDEEKTKPTESESATRETADELDSEQMDDSTDRNEEKSDDQEQEE